MNKFTKHLFLSLSLILSVTVLFSCKKDDASGTTNSSAKNAKFTITVTGVDAAADVVDFSILGDDPNNSKTIWKVNGVVQNNETDIDLDEYDFAGSTTTYVVESTMPLNHLSAIIQSITYNAPFTISFKAEINGKVVTNDQNVAIAVGKSYVHTFSY